LIAGTLLVSTAAFADEGNATRGEAVYSSICAACHALDANRIGPRHRGVFGRRAASVPDFSYSPALRQSGVVWDAAALDRWLTSPQQFIPGQKMDFSLTDAQKRADVIAYLRQLSSRPTVASAGGNAPRQKPD
jgi:cytochrome c